MGRYYIGRAEKAYWTRGKKEEEEGERG